MGYRTSPWRPKPHANDGKVSDSKIAWATTVHGTWETRQFLPGEPDLLGIAEDGQIGPNIRIGIIRRNTTRLISFDLTALTAEELEATKKLFNLAFDLAEPVVKYRDEVARRAKAEGDDSYVRSYRQLPTFVVRKGKIATYSEGVLHRPDDVPAGPRGLSDADRDGGGGAGGVGDGLADEEPQDAGPEDDGAAADES